MTHIFKSGDRAYWVKYKKWVELEENPIDASKMYPLRIKGGSDIFAEDGKDCIEDGTPALLPINPYDLTDPNNPPEFRWHFFLNGRPVDIGDELILKHNQESLRLWVTSLIYGKDGPKVCGNPSFGYFLLTPENFYWPDEVVVKKKVADWMCAVIKLSGEIELNHEKGMTEEDVKRVYGVYGSHIQMVPGTERDE